jgi:hypothetical protein
MTLAAAIKDLVYNTLDQALISSSGGDSPKTNRVMAIPEIDTAQLETEMEQLGILQESGETLEVGESGQGGGFGLSATDIAGIIRNPSSAAFSALMTAAAPVIAPLVIQQTVEAVIDQLTRPGGILDTRFRREVLNEVNAFLTRQQQQNTRIGDRNVIIQAAPGFSNRGGFGHDSILRRISENRGDDYRTSGIGLNDKANGVRP